MHGTQTSLWIPGLLYIHVQNMLQPFLPPLPNICGVFHVWQSSTCCYLFVPLILLLVFTGLIWQTLLKCSGCSMFSFFWFLGTWRVFLPATNISDTRVFILMMVWSFWCNQAFPHFLPFSNPLPFHQDFWQVQSRQHVLWLVCASNLILCTFHVKGTVYTHPFSPLL